MSAGGVRLSGGLTEACLHVQEVLQTLAQNRMGKDNAAIEFSRTSLLQRTWPRLRSVATLYIVALTLPISILGCVALVVLHILRGGRLLALSPHPTSNTRKGYQPTAIVTGVHCHIHLLGSQCSTACCTPSTLTQFDQPFFACCAPSMPRTAEGFCSKCSSKQLLYALHGVLLLHPIYCQRTTELMCWAVIHCSSADFGTSGLLPSLDLQMCLCWRRPSQDWSMFHL